MARKQKIERMKVLRNRGKEPIWKQTLAAATMLGVKGMRFGRFSPRQRTEDDGKKTEVIYVYATLVVAAAAAANGLAESFNGGSVGASFRFSSVLLSSSVGKSHYPGLHILPRGVHEFLMLYRNCQYFRKKVHQVSEENVKILNSSICSVHVRKTGTICE